MRERVLVVDDEPGMLRTVERVLDGRYDVVTAGSAARALELAAAAPPDVAILDVRMPAVDGFELLGRLREVAGDVDVIFITGVVHEADAQLVRSIRERAFYFIQKPFDREVLLTLVQRCLELRRLSRENREHLARLEDELRQARNFQRSLLPPPQRVLEQVQLVAGYEPCDELGGDLYDYATDGRGGVVALVADVSGHGVSAAMLTAIVKSGFRDCVEEGFAPAAVVRRVAGAIRSFQVHRFVTLLCARLAPRERSLSWVNAGHPPALLRRAGGELLRLGATGTIVSPALPDSQWDERSLPLGPGDRLLVYTDGVTETAGPEEPFGEDRLARLLERSAAEPGPFVAALLGAAREHAAGRPAEDDRTVLLACAP